MSSKKMAASRSLTVEKQYEDYGFLDLNHQWEFVKKNNLIDCKEEDIDFDLQCGLCFDIHEIDSQKWTSRIIKRELIEESVEFHVSCGGCGQEMEFGWSKPDRTGGIWPVECLDFDPENVWPEPRFRERWSQKGWMKPERLFESFYSESKIRTLIRKSIKRAF